MKVINCVQGTPEWHAARAGRVTASRIADVIARTKSGPSASRAAYMAELIAERLTGVVADGYTNIDMQRGIDTEPAARSAYEVHTGSVVQQVGFIVHPTIEQSGASPDGLVDDGLLEIKCPKTNTHIDYLLAKEPPAKYLPQMAWQCACAGREWVDFASYDPRLPAPLDLFIVRYVPDPAYIAELESEVRRFLDELEAKLEALRRIAA